MSAPKSEGKMKYYDGTVVRVGDQVCLGGDMTGAVVCSIDDGIYSDEYPRHVWSYLKTGVLVLSPEAGIVHYPELPNDFALMTSI